MSKGEPRLEVWDVAGVIDVSWVEWELLVNAVGVRFTRWVMTHPLEYSAWLERIGRTNSHRPTRSRWPWRR